MFMVGCEVSILGRGTVVTNTNEPRGVFFFLVVLFCCCCFFVLLFCFSGFDCFISLFLFEKEPRSLA